MNFLQQTITIRDIHAHTHTIMGWTGEGTGLAYVQTLDINHQLIKDTYNLMHVPSGYALPHHVSTEAEAQAYLEKVARIFADQWTCDIRAVTKRLRPHILAQIELAHYDSLAPHVDYFLYAVTGDEDLCGESEDAVGKDPLSPENEKIAQQLLAEYPEATKAMMVSVADADGIHRILRTFEREGVVLVASTEEA